MEHGIFQGIVVQKAFKMGYVGVRETVKMLRGEAIRRILIPGASLVTPDNMYTSEIEKLLFPFNTLKTYGDLTTYNSHKCTKKRVKYLPDSKYLTFFCKIFHYNYVVFTVLYRKQRCV